MVDESIPKGWAICEFRAPAFRCGGCGKLAVSGWKKLPDDGYCCDACGPRPNDPVKVPKAAQEVRRALPESGGKKRGRPAGSKNRRQE